MMGFIKIIGTSHISEESVQELKQAILDSKPDIVAVELDKHRLKSLFSKRQLPGLSDIPRIGLLGVLFARIGGSIQASLGKKIGLAPGEDMKTSIIAAKKVGAKIALIDQPIEKTLTALSQKVHGWEKLRFSFFLLGALLFPFTLKFASHEAKKIDLRKVPSDKLINEVLSEVKQKFPNFHKVLVEDRNKYMASQLRRLASKFHNSKIIAVVGAGHEKAIAKLISI